PSYTSAADIEKPFANSWDISKGLVNNNVYDIAEDQLGRIWLATPGGVSIVDGLGVTNLKSDPGQSGSISSNVITKVVRHKDSMLVLGLHGIDIVSPFSLKATPVDDPQNLLVRAINILFINEDTAYIVAQNKLIRWSVSLNRVEEVKAVTHSFSVNAVYRFDDNEVLLSTPEGYYLFNHNSSHISVFQIAGFERKDEDVRANSIDSSNNRLWISVFGKGLYIVADNALFKQFSVNNSGLPSNLISKVFQRGQHVYVVTRKGIVVFDVDSLEHIRTIQPTTHHDSYMKSDMALTADFRSNGDLLVGTTDGFFVINHNQNHPYIKLSETHEGINKLGVVESFTADEKLLIRTSNNILSVKDDGDFINIPKETNHLSLNPIAQHHGLLLYEDNKVAVVSHEESKILEVRGLPEGVKLTEVIRDNEDGRFFLFDDTHLYISKRVEDTLVVQLSRNIGNVLVADAKVYNDVLYLATQRAGLLSIPYYSVNNSNVELERIAGPEVPINLFIDSKRKFWVLTLEDGYYYHDDGDVNIQPKPFKQELTDFDPVCIAEDGNGFLWFVTNTGVSVFSPSLELVGRFYNEIEVSERFKVNNCGRVKENIFISIPGEIFIFNAWDEITKIPTLNLGYSDISVNGNSVSGTEQRQYIEPSILSFELYSSSLNFESDYQLLYRVIEQSPSQRDESEDKWLQSNSREINLIKPNIGDFVIEAQILLSDGTRSQIAKYSFSIEPPYYRSSPMLLLYVLLALGVLSLLFFYKLKLKNSELQVAKVESEKQQEYAKLLTQEVDEKTQLYKEQQQLAVQANIDKTRFLASASHDIRAPLNAIRWKLHELLDSTHPSTQQLMEEISILDQLVQSIVNLSKFDAKIIKANFEVFDLNELINELKTRFNQALDTNKVEISIKPHEPQTHVFTDKFLLLRLINNIVDNAIKSLHGGGHIEIIIQQINDQRILVSIEDDGPGIDESLQTKVFDSFIRGTQKYAGTGLGLTIVKQISEVLELDLKLESSTDSGTKFWFELQSAEEQEGVDKPNLDKEAGLTALVIDDDPFYANDARVKVEELGFITTMIDDMSNIDDAFSAGYDLILCDYNLGIKINGIDLLVDKLVREKLLCNQIIIMSEDSSVKAKAKEKEGFQFLRKPIKRSKLSWLYQQNS
ncbi:response regulator, partial [Kangiella sp. HD9-110m-PIT-SAG07]